MNVNEIKSDLEVALGDEISWSEIDDDETVLFGGSTETLTPAQIDELHDRIEAFAELREIGVSPIEDEHGRFMYVLTA